MPDGAGEGFPQISAGGAANASAVCCLMLLSAPVLGPVLGPVFGATAACMAQGSRPPGKLRAAGRGTGCGSKAAPPADAEPGAETGPKGCAPGLADDELAGDGSANDGSGPSVISILYWPTCNRSSTCTGHGLFTRVVAPLRNVPLVDRSTKIQPPRSGRISKCRDEISRCGSGRHQSKPLSRPASSICPGSSHTSSGPPSGRLVMLIIRRCRRGWVMMGLT